MNWFGQTYKNLYWPVQRFVFSVEYKAYSFPALNENSCHNCAKKSFGVEQFKCIQKENQNRQCRVQCDLNRTELWNLHIVS